MSMETSQLGNDAKHPHHMLRPMLSADIYSNCLKINKFHILYIGLDNESNLGIKNYICIIMDHSIQPDPSASDQIQVIIFLSMIQSNLKNPM